MRSRVPSLASSGNASSTSSMRGTGLKTCRAANRSGRPLARASAWTESERRGCRDHRVGSARTASRLASSSPWRRGPRRSPRRRTSIRRVPRGRWWLGSSPWRRGAWPVPRPCPRLWQPSRLSGRAARRRRARRRTRRDRTRLRRFPRRRPALSSCSHLPGWPGAITPDRNSRRGVPSRLAHRR